MAPQYRNDFSRDVAYRFRFSLADIRRWNNNNIHRCICIDTLTYPPNYTSTQSTYIQYIPKLNVRNKVLPRAGKRAYIAEYVLVSDRDVSTVIFHYLYILKGLINTQCH